MMDKARQFLTIYENSSNYSERLLSLYNGLFLLLGERLYDEVEKCGVDKASFLDALKYIREDEEGGRTILDERNLEALYRLLSSLLSD